MVSLSSGIRLPAVADHTGEFSSQSVQLTHPDMTPATFRSAYGRSSGQSTTRGGEPHVRGARQSGQRMDRGMGNWEGRFVTISRSGVIPVDEERRTPRSSGGAAKENFISRRGLSISEALSSAPAQARELLVMVNHSRSHRTARGSVRARRFGWLVFALVALVISSGVGSEQGSARAGSSAQPSAFASPGPPPLPPGYDVTFVCSYGKAFLNGSTVCHDESILVDVCASGTCWYNLTGSGDLGGNEFHGWSYSGTDLSIACHGTGCAWATLTVTLPSQDKSLTGSVTLLYTRQVAVIVAVFVNWVSGFEPGEVQICGSDCASYQNNQTADLQTNETYSLTGVNLSAGYDVSQWTSTAGTLSSGSGTETLAVSGAGALSMILDLANLGWGGYVFDPPSDSGVLSVTGTFFVPQFGSGGPYRWNAAFWLGIGGVDNGLNTTPLWQAGITIFWTPPVSPTPGYYTYMPFWEEVNSTVQKYVTDSSFSVYASDKVTVDVTFVSGSCGFDIYDNSTGGSWTGSEPFTPSITSADWIVEGNGLPSGLDFTANFSYVELNERAPSLESSILGVSTASLVPLGMTRLGLFPRFLMTVN